MDCLTHDVVVIKGQRVACLVAEYIEGEILENFVKNKKRVGWEFFPAIHLLYSIVSGVKPFTGWANIMVTCMLKISLSVDLASNLI